MACFNASAGPAQSSQLVGDAFPLCSAQASRWPRISALVRAAMGCKPLVWVVKIPDNDARKAVRRFSSDTGTKSCTKPQTSLERRAMSNTCANGPGGWALARSGLVAARSMRRARKYSRKLRCEKPYSPSGVRDRKAAVRNSTSNWLGSSLPRRSGRSLSIANRSP